MNFEIDYLLITGNGFDMDLGLETSYKRFIESDEWELMRCRRKKENSSPSLIDFIEKKFKLEGWADLESAMLEYVLPNDDGTFVNNAIEDKKDYDAICKSLVEYLCNLFWKPTPTIIANRMSSSFAGYFLSIFFDPLSDNGHNALYTFNYTPLDIIYGVVGGWPTTSEYYNLHGGIKKEDFLEKNYNNTSIILGIMTDRKIAPGYSFLVKSNHPLYSQSEIEHDLLMARHVIIYGHSLNKIDFGYFDSYFKLLASNIDKDRMLSIITKDESSKDTIIKNLEEMRVPIDVIFANTNIEFSFTSNYKKGVNI